MKFRLDVPLAGRPQDPHSGPMTLTASGYSQSMVHTTSLSFEMIFMGNPLDKEDILIKIRNRNPGGELKSIVLMPGQ